MNIEEMAEFIVSPENDFHKSCHKMVCPEILNEDSCQCCAKQWLESEVEE